MIFKTQEQAEAYGEDRELAGLAFGGFLDDRQRHDRRPRLTLPADDCHVAGVVGGVEEAAELVASLADCDGLFGTHAPKGTSGTPRGTIGTVHLGYRYRLDPTPGQRIALSKAFGCARVVFNDAVAARQAARETGAPFPTNAALSKALAAAKRTPERAWLAEVSAVALQQALADADSAYRYFFARLKSNPTGRRVNTPRFRSKRDRVQSIRFVGEGFMVRRSGVLRLARIGDVAVRWSRVLPAEPSSVTVSVDATGRYHASFVVEVPDAPLSPVQREVGIDLGLTHFAVMSDGRKVDNPRYARKAAAKLRRRHKELSRRQNGSANWEKSRRKVAKSHARVVDTRRDWLHKLSTTVVRENQLIAVEDLSVSGLARTRLARSVNDAGWSAFTNMLAYKAKRAGRIFVKVDRWFPSTRTCSDCGVIGEAKRLEVRAWTCRCGTTHDRDINAARNILAAGRAENPTPVELVLVEASVSQSAVKQEPAGSAARSRADRDSRPSGHGGRQGEDLRDGVLEPYDSADQGAHDYEQAWLRQGGER